eukprot:g4754.t1
MHRGEHGQRLLGTQSSHRSDSFPEELKNAELVEEDFDVAGDGQGSMSEEQQGTPERRTPRRVASFDTLHARLPIESPDSKRDYYQSFKDKMPHSRSFAQVSPAGAVDRHRRCRALIVLSLLLSLASAVIVAILLIEKQTVPPPPLEQDELLGAYIASNDNTQYGLTELEPWTGEGFMVLRYQLSSLRWSQSRFTGLDSASQDWWHYVEVYIPNAGHGATALLMIGDGLNNQTSPPAPCVGYGSLAVSVGALVVLLHDAPNQPLLYPNDPTQQLTEDTLLAVAWNYFLRTADPDPASLPRFPCVKSAVVAMNLVQANWGDVKRFAVSGSQQRAWTAWLLSTQDVRVCALLPLSLPIASPLAGLSFAYRTLGSWPRGWSAFQQYRIFDWFTSPQLSSLLYLLDPLTYRSTLPAFKVLLLGSADDLLPPDATSQFFSSLPDLDTTFLRVVPNADSVVLAQDAPDLLAPFMRALLSAQPLPVLYWSAMPCQPHSSDVCLTATMRTTLDLKVLLWSCANPLARDFRSVQSDCFEATDVRAKQPGTWSVNISAPAQGYRAGFLEFSFPTGPVVTTEFVVAPPTLPFPPPPDLPYPPNCSLFPSIFSSLLFSSLLFSSHPLLILFSSSSHLLLIFFSSSSHLLLIFFSSSSHPLLILFLSSSHPLLILFLSSSHPLLILFSSSSYHLLILFSTSSHPLLTLSSSSPHPLLVLFSSSSHPLLILFSSLLILFSSSSHPLLILFSSSSHPLLILFSSSSLLFSSLLFSSLLVRVSSPTGLWSRVVDCDIHR